MARTPRGAGRGALDEPIRSLAEGLTRVSREHMDGIEHAHLHISVWLEVDVQLHPPCISLPAPTLMRMCVSQDFSKDTWRMMDKLFSGKDSGRRARQIQKDKEELQRLYRLARDAGHVVDPASSVGADATTREEASGDSQSHNFGIPGHKGQRSHSEISSACTLLSEEHLSASGQCEHEGTEGNSSEGLLPGNKTMQTSRFPGGELVELSIDSPWRDLREGS